MNLLQVYEVRKRLRSIGYILHGVFVCPETRGEEIISSAFAKTLKALPSAARYKGINPELGPAVTIPGVIEFGRISYHDVSKLELDALNEALRHSVKREKVELPLPRTEIA